MSHYQYHEFVTSGRALDRAATDALRSISSRAEITVGRFAVEHNHGGLRGDPVDIVARWFDVGLYVSNWGDRRFLVAVPDGVPDWPFPREDDPAARLRIVKAHGRTIVDMHVRSEDAAGWCEEGPEWMPRLVRVRELLFAGDRRALYLAWLAPRGESEEPDPDELEPPVPPGLATLPPELSALSEFLLVDPDLLRIAAEASPPPKLPTRDDYARWLKTVPEGEKDELLARLLAGEIDAELRSELAARHHAETAPPAPPPGSEPRRRAYGELLDAGARLAANRAAFERAEAASARERHLRGIAEREPEFWARVEALVAEKKAAAYDEAVGVLVELRDLATLRGTTDPFDARIRALRADNAKKPSFIERLNDKGFR